MGGGLAVGPGEGHHALVHLDPDHHASALQVLGEELAGVCLLVHGLVEEDHASDAGVDALVSCEEQLAVQPPVLLGVLSIDALEALGHATWGHTGEQKRLTDGVEVIVVLSMTLPAALPNTTSSKVLHPAPFLPRAWRVGLS